MRSHKFTAVSLSVITALSVSACSADSIEDHHSTSSTQSSNAPAKESGKVHTNDHTPAKHKDALKRAEHYLEGDSDVSKKDLRGMLLEVDKFDKESVDYALENVHPDWNKNALNAAEKYLGQGGMPADTVRDMLVNLNGFLESEADYAMEHLPQP